MMELVRKCDAEEIHGYTKHKDLCQHDSNRMMCYLFNTINLSQRPHNNLVKKKNNTFILYLLEYPHVCNVVDRIGHTKGQLCLAYRIFDNYCS